MKRLTTRDDRAFRAYTVAGVLVGLVALIAIVGTAIQTGVGAFIGFGGGLAVCGLVAWVIHWIDTGRWFR